MGNLDGRFSQGAQTVLHRLSTLTAGGAGSPLPLGSFLLSLLLSSEIAIDSEYITLLPGQTPAGTGVLDHGQQVAGRGVLRPASLSHNDDVEVCVDQPQWSSVAPGARLCISLSAHCFQTPRLSDTWADSGADLLASELSWEALATWPHDSEPLPTAV